MIYYFSGTGNSRYAAEKLAILTEDKCVSIASIFNGNPPDVAGRSDVTGFVFPAYYGGLPEMVKRFASHREIKTHLGFYVYSVITCGAEAGAAGVRLSQCLEHRVDMCVQLPMPDNYIMLYNPSDSDTAKQKLKAADAALTDIADMVETRTRFGKVNIRQKALTAVMYPFYNLFRVTFPFSADEKCTHCGLCAKICPERAIKIKNGKPVWVKKKCQHCTACINRCPADAIQFGLLTEKRSRYAITKLK